MRRTAGGEAFDRAIESKPVQDDDALNLLRMVVEDLLEGLPDAHRQMIELHSLDPRYGFDRHKGYATADHLDAVARFGYSDVHRRTFRPPTLFDTMD